MKTLIACVFLIFAASAAGSQEGSAEWRRVFGESFETGLSGRRLAVDPYDWLSRNKDLLAESERTGADPRDAGMFAARLAAEWDLDMRSGVPLQEANARLRQSFLIESRLGPSGERRIAEARRSAVGPSSGSAPGNGPGGFRSAAGRGRSSFQSGGKR